MGHSTASPEAMFKIPVEWHGHENKREKEWHLLLYSNYPHTLRLWVPHESTVEKARTGEGIACIYIYLIVFLHPYWDVSIFITLGFSCHPLSRRSGEDDHETPTSRGGKKCSGSHVYICLNFTYLWHSPNFYFDLSAITLSLRKYDVANSFDFAIHWRYLGLR